MIDQVFSTINFIVIGIASGALLLPMLYTVLLVLPQKKYPKAKTKHKFAVIVCARNEEKVVGNLIASIRAQNYPKDKVDICVVAHNCQDRTAEIARGQGADIVLELNDPDRRHARKGYALNYAFDILMEEYQDHEAYIVMDADNLMSASFIDAMNDALDAGVEVGTGFRNSKNWDDNCISGSNGLILLRDCRINAHARTLLHSTAPLTGTGFFIKRSVAVDMGGWQAFNIVEDLDYTAQLLMKNHRSCYVPKAEFFDEQPSGIRDSLVRQTRIGKGVFQLFFKHGPKLLLHFFTTLRLGFIDMFLYLLYAPVATLACFWFPFYYIYQPVMMLVHGDPAAFGGYLLMVLQMILLYVVTTITVQNIIVMLTEYRRITFQKKSRIVTTLIAFPWYNLCCAVAIMIGVLNPKLWWAPIKHDKAVTIEDVMRKKSAVKKLPAAEE